MKYFKHDTTAATDAKILQLRAIGGSFFVDFYYFILERIYLDEKPLKIRDANALRPYISFFHVSVKKALNAIDTMLDLDLLKTEVNDETSVYSERAMEAIKEVSSKSEKARESAMARWNKASERNANAMRTDSERNANAMPYKTKTKTKTIEGNKNYALNGSNSYSPSNSDSEKRADRASYGEQHGPAFSLPICPKCSGILTISKSGFHCASCNQTFNQNEIKYKTEA